MRRLAFALQRCVTLLACAFLVLPAACSALTGLTANYFQGLSSGLTTEWVARVWGLYADTVWRSMGIALGTLVVTLAIGVPGAWALAHRPGRLSRLVEEFVSLPLAVLGLALALALLQVYGTWRGFRVSPPFVLVGHVLYTLPFMLRAVMAVMRGLDLPRLEAAAATLGATPFQRFRDIAVPNALPGILAGALTVVTLSVGEFNLTWMLHTPLTKTLPMGLADNYASMRLEIASAYTLVFFVMVLPLLMAMQWAARSRRPARDDRDRAQRPGQDLPGGAVAVRPCGLAIALGERLRGMPRPARMAEVLELCKVGERAGRPVSALSGGQRERVALARAVAVRPRALLLDEPLSALDASLRERLREDLARLLRAFAIIAVFVTHDQAEAMAIADRVAVMREGRIVQIDTPRGLYLGPADAWVARFVGGAAALGGRVEGGWLHLPDGRLPVGRPVPPGTPPCWCAPAGSPWSRPKAPRCAARWRGRASSATTCASR